MTVLAELLAADAAMRDEIGDGVVDLVKQHYAVSDADLSDRLAVYDVDLTAADVAALRRLLDGVDDLATVIDAALMDGIAASARPAPWLPGVDAS